MPRKNPEATKVCHSYRNAATHRNVSMQAYDEAQQMILDGTDRDDVEMRLVKNYPDLNAHGLVPTILRRAYRDLAEL